MWFNPARAKKVQEVVFSRKTNKIIYRPRYFNNATVRLTHTLKHISLQIATKLQLNDILTHTKNKISKATKDTVLLRKMQPILRHISLFIPYQSFMSPLTMVMLFMTNCPMHHFQTKWNQYNLR